MRGIISNKTIHVCTHRGGQLQRRTPCSKASASQGLPGSSRTTAHAAAWSHALLWTSPAPSGNGILSLERCPKNKGFHLLQDLAHMKGVLKRSLWDPLNLVSVLSFEKRGSAWPRNERPWAHSRLPNRSRHCRRNIDPTVTSDICQCQYFAVTLRKKGERMGWGESQRGVCFVFYVVCDKCWQEVGAHEILTLSHSCFLSLCFLLFCPEISGSGLISKWGKDTC